MTNVFGVVSGRLLLDPGNYLVVGKLYAAHAAGMTFGLACELRQGEITLDFAGTVLATNREIPVTLMSTTVVQDPPEEVTIVCRTGASGAVATALAAQLVAVAVDKVDGP